MKDQVLKTMDKNGYIGQISVDKKGNSFIEGGDTINRQCLYHFLIKVNKNLDYDIGEIEDLPKRTRLDLTIALDNLEGPDKDGNFMRHPNPNSSVYGWASFKDETWGGCMSRDQTTPLVIVLGYFKLYTIYTRYLKAAAKRFFTFTNQNIKNNTDPNILTNRKWQYTDATLFEFWATILRGIPILPWLLYPIICLLDMETLVGSLVWKYKRKDDDDILNHAANCIYGMQRIPTPTMWLACKILKADSVMEKMVMYWTHWRKQPFFVELFSYPVRKYFR